MLANKEYVKCFQNIEGNVLFITVIMSHAESCLSLHALVFRVVEKADMSRHTQLVNFKAICNGIELDNPSM